MATFCHGWDISLDAAGLNLDNLRIKDVVGAIFSPFAVAMGVPPAESLSVGSLLGTKMVINEFVAYSDLSPLIHNSALSAKSVVIASFALCGFANFSSVAIQLGGIGDAGSRPPGRSCKARYKGNDLRNHGIIYLGLAGRDADRVELHGDYAGSSCVGPVVIPGEFLHQQITPLFASLWGLRPDPPASDRW